MGFLVPVFMAERKCSKFKGYLDKKLHFGSHASKVQLWNNCPRGKEKVWGGKLHLRNLGNYRDEGIGGRQRCHLCFISHECVDINKIEETVCVCVCERGKGGTVREDNRRRKMLGFT